MQSNRERSRALISGTIIYAIGNIGTKILSFLIVPLYTYFIKPGELGIYDFLISTISLLTPIITLQISDAAYSWMITNTEDSERYVQATYRVIVINSIISATTIYIINYFVNIAYINYFVILLILSLTFSTIHKLLRGLKNQVLFVTSSILYTSVFLGLNVLQICVLHQGIEALFTSAIISYAIAIVFVLYKERRLRVFKIVKADKKITKEFLRVSIPIIPNQLNWWVMNSSDRYIILLFLGSTANGIYSITYKFPAILQMIFSLFYTSWQDMILADREDAQDYYCKIFALYYKLAFTSILFITPLTKVIIKLVMEASYHDSAKYVAFLYLGVVFQAFSSFYGVGYLKSKNTKGAASTSIYGALVNIIINLLCIRFIGLYAAAISTFIGFFVMWLVRVIQTRKMIRIDFNTRMFTVYFIMAVLISIVTIKTSFVTDIVLGIMGLLIFSIINCKEIKYMLTIVIKKIRHKVA